MSKDFELHGIETIKPVGKRILIRLNLVGERKTEGGIILPDLHREPCRIGYVLAIGEEVDRVKVGDKILVSWIFGDVLDFPDRSLNDDTVRMGTQSEIWAKIKE